MTSLANEARTRAKNLQPRDPGSAELFRRLALVNEQRDGVIGTLVQGMGEAFALLRGFAAREDIAADTIEEINKLLATYPEIATAGDAARPTGPRMGDWFWLTDDNGVPFANSHGTLEDLYDYEDPLDSIITVGHGIELPTVYALRLPYEDETVIETFRSLPEAEAARDRFYADHKAERAAEARDEKEAQK